MLDASAEVPVEPGACDSGGASARDHDLGVLDAAAGDVQGIQERGSGDDGGAVLIVVEDGDVQALGEPGLDLEALGCPDVLEVDTPETRRDELTDPHHVVRVFARDLDVEDVDVREALEEDSLALHDGFSRQRANVAEAEHSGAVGDHGDQVALGRVAEHLVGICSDLAARLGHPGGIGHGEVPLGHGGLGGHHLELAGRTPRVVLEGFLAGDEGLPGGQRGVPFEAPGSWRGQNAVLLASLSDHPWVC